VVLFGAWIIRAFSQGLNASLFLKDELLASTDLAQFGIRKIKRFIVIPVV
jgi:hypothetical protein